MTEAARPVAAEPMMADDASAGAAAALRRLAADPALRAAFAAPESPLALLLAPAARRYVSVGDRAHLLPGLRRLAGWRYGATVECIGEDTTDPGRVAEVRREYRALIADLAGIGGPARVGFDLSNLGLLIDPADCRSAVADLAAAGAAAGVGLIVSMERSALVDPILEAWQALAPAHPDLALTLQAHLHRTPGDIAALDLRDRPIRLVKGAYAEPAETALPRSPALDRRYLECLEALVAGGAQVSVATQDAALLDAAAAAGLLGRVADVEMFYGIAQPLAKRLRRDGVPVRLLSVYGSGWFLYFLHRLDEYPANVLEALADHADPTRIPGPDAYAPD